MATNEDKSAPADTAEKKAVMQAANILDPDFVIGVWASASRPALRTLNADGTHTHTGSYVQVSRIGMPYSRSLACGIPCKVHTGLGMACRGARVRAII